MADNQDTSLHVNDYRFTVPQEQLLEMHRVLVQAAQAGQSPYPFKPELNLKEMVLVVWGLDLFSNRRDRALTELHIPLATSIQILDTFLSLIAPFVAMDKAAYFDVVCQAEEGDQEFFYHFENGKVIKEERITMYIPAELAIKLPRDAAQEETMEGNVA